MNAACDRLADAVIPFREKYIAMLAGLTHLELVYRRERNTQQNLPQEAQGMEVPGKEGRNSWHSIEESLSGLTTARAMDSLDEMMRLIYLCITQRFNRMGTKRSKKAMWSILTSLKDRKAHRRMQ